MEHRKLPSSATFLFLSVWHCQLLCDRRQRWDPPEGTTGGRDPQLRSQERVTRLVSTSWGSRAPLVARKKCGGQFSPAPSPFLAIAPRNMVPGGALPSLCDRGYSSSHSHTRCYVACPRIRIPSTLGGIATNSTQEMGLVYRCRRKPLACLGLIPRAPAIRGIRISVFPQCSSVSSPCAHELPRFFSLSCVCVPYCPPLRLPRYHADMMVVW